MVTPIACDPPRLDDYLATWRITLPSTVTGSTFTHCSDPMLDGTAVVFPTEAPCPEDPMSPCPAVLNFDISVYLKEYHPGGDLVYGIVGTTAAGHVLFAGFDNATCTASFSISQGEAASFGCAGPVAESHREIFASCSNGAPPHEGPHLDRPCDISPPIEPLVEFLHAEPAP